MLLTAGLSPRQALIHAGVDSRQLTAHQPPSPSAFLWEVWRFGIDTGASLSYILNSLSRALSEASENARAARSQLAGPKAATRLVMVLPGIAIAGAIVAGYNPLAFLFLQPVGWILLLISIALMWMAHRWSAALVRSAQQSHWATGMPSEVMALGLSSGLALSQARNLAQNFSHRFGDHPAELEQCDRYVELAAHTGVALSELLRSNAALLRSQSRTTSHEAIERLSVQLMVPLGVCVLPAFIATGVLPLVASVISSTTLR